MSLQRLRLRNLLYHWRGNSAVFLGVVVGTAVLTGALLVGDSLRGSLRELALRRLGWVDQALIAPRFFREKLAEELKAGGAAERVCPALLLQATVVVNDSKGEVRSQVRGVTVMGVDERFWPTGTIASDQVWLNDSLARALDVSAGGQIELRLQKPSAVPRESLLGRDKDVDVVENWERTVGRVLQGDEAGNHFSLRPGLEAPRNAFVSLKDLQNKLGLGGQVNALLAGGAKPNLQEQLQSKLTLADWGLVLHTPEERTNALFAKLDGKREGQRAGKPDGKLQPREWQGQLATSVVQAMAPGRSAPTLTREEVEAYYRKVEPYLCLESKNLLLEPAAASAALEAAKETDLRAAPTLVYLANTIAAGGKEIPYSVVAALDPALPPPLGPFLPPGVTKLRDDQIVLADWKESPLPTRTGEEVTLLYFPPTHAGGKWPQESKTFKLAGLVPLTGVSGDPDLTPEFPGITDKLKVSEWSPPFEYHGDRVKQSDEDYWKEYRTTPKAYVNLAVGQRLWGSRFGRLTSIRMAPNSAGADLNRAATAFRDRLLAHLPPAKGGLVFDPVRANALKVSSGSTDFAGLFLGFSFFLIAAALLLVGLLFRLNLDRRAAEIGLLTAVGYRRNRIRMLLLGEGAVLAGAGVVAGCGLAIVYADYLVQLLAALWPGGVLKSFLHPHVSALSLVLGAAASFLVCVLTIAWAVYFLGRVAPGALLAGQTSGESELGLVARSRWRWWLAGGSLVGAVALVACSGSVKDAEKKAETFFGGGALLLTAFLAAMAAWMRGSRQALVEGHGWWSIARLGMRNAARNPGRSLLTTGLLASAAFLLVAVEAFRRSASAGEASTTAANGGFELLAESDLPLFHDLKGKEAREAVLERAFPVLNDQTKKEIAEARELLKDTQFFAFRVRAGDDISCLNLYQPRQPRLLGVPAALIHRGGFVFAGTKAQDAAEKKNPWTILERKGGAVPVFGENNTVTWILKKGLGDEVQVKDGSGAEVPLQIDGLLQDSVFQSSLLLSEEHFLHLYPDQEGYRFFLIQPPVGKATEVKKLLERGLADRGFEVTPTAERLESYLAVENTYLSTFQALGGLGLILGSLGLAVVLLRAVWERRAELALLRALGYRRATLGWLVLAENGFLLLLGLGAGTLAAVVAVAPHLLFGAVPWRELLVLLGLALLVGLGAGALAVMATLRAPLVPALRRE